MVPRNIPGPRTLREEEIFCFSISRVTEDRAPSREKKSLRSTVRSDFRDGSFRNGLHFLGTQHNLRS